MGRSASVAEGGFEVEEEIRIDGVAVLRGNGHLGVIYNNLAGLNFGGEEYGQYLAFMARHLCLEKLDGRCGMQFLANLTEVASCRLGDPQAVRVTRQSELQALKEQAQALKAEAQEIRDGKAVRIDAKSDSQRLEEIRRLLEASPFGAVEEELVVSSG
jgi:hypothetical protein